MAIDFESMSEEEYLQLMERAKSHGSKLAKRKAEELKGALDILINALNLNPAVTLKSANDQLDAIGWSLAYVGRVTDDARTAIEMRLPKPTSKHDFTIREILALSAEMEIPAEDIRRTLASPYFTLVRSEKQRGRSCLYKRTPPPKPEPSKNNRRGKP